MNTPISRLKESIQTVRYNSAAIQRLALETLESVSAGTIDVVDPSNPFVFLMESSAVNTSAAMVHFEAQTRMQYPSMAVTEDELYMHMSDKDYIGRFASPSRTTFTMLFNKAEVTAKAIPSGTLGINKLVIPKHTEFKIADYVFTMQYPVEMRVMDYGGIQVVYDGSDPSPLEVLKDNIAEWDTVNIEGEDYIRIKVPVSQFIIKSKYNQISKAVAFEETYPFEDDFYYCRVYRSLGLDQWSEIKTTHTDQVFDPTVVTAVLKVYDNRIKISIPQVYLDAGLITGTVRMDIYTTKGKLDLLLDSYQINAFTARWIDRDLGDETDAFATPLNSFSNMAVFSDAAVNGGVVAIPFGELRERVLNNALGDSQIPITDVQLSTRLANRGYESIKDIDNVTNRVYLASRKLPVPANTNTSSAASSVIGTLQTSYGELVDRLGVYDNGAGITISPNTLFKLENGILKLVPNGERLALESLTGIEYVDIINDSNYLFTPFHYVLDAGDKFFETRAYYLDDPSERHKEFVEENIDLGIYISTDTFSIRKKETGYVLQITTKSDTVIKELPDYRVMPLLSFTPTDQRSEAFLEGTLLATKGDGERIYEFDLSTNFDIDKDHNLILNGFKMYSNDILNYNVPLNMVFDLVYYIREIGNELPSLNYRPLSYLVSDYDRGVVHERIGIKFGTHLDGFWNRSRSVLESNIYQVYETTVYSYYDKNIYVRDANTGAVVLTRDPVTGDLTTTLLFTKGDPILDENGYHAIKHKIGDPVLDINGKPIIDNVRSVLRELDMFLIDGRYLFSTFPKDLDYLKELPKSIVSWLENDVAEFREWLIEQTEMLLYPQRTFGNSKFLVLDGEETTLNLEQAFTVSFYLNREKFDDVFLRDSLKHLAIDVLSSELSKTRIKTNEIISKLTASAGDDVIAIDLKGLGGVHDFATISIIDKTDRCSIRKKLSIDLDGTYKVVDDVEVLFIRHEN